MSGRCVLLVGPDENRSRGSEMYPSSALLTLGTLLYQQGHDVRIVPLLTQVLPLQHRSLIHNSGEPC